MDTSAALKEFLTSSFKENQKFTDLEKFEQVLPEESALKKFGFSLERNRFLNEYFCALTSFQKNEKYNELLKQKYMLPKEEQDLINIGTAFAIFDFADNVEAKLTTKKSNIFKRASIKKALNTEIDERRRAMLEAIQNHKLLLGGASGDPDFLAEYNENLKTIFLDKHNFLLPCRTGVLDSDYTKSINDLLQSANSPILKSNNILSSTEANNEADKSNAPLVKSLYEMLDGGPSKSVPRTSESYFEANSPDAPEPEQNPNEPEAPHQSTSISNPADLNHNTETEDKEIESDFNELYLEAQKFMEAEEANRLKEHNDLEAALNKSEETSIDTSQHNS